MLFCVFVWFFVEWCIDFWFCFVLICLDNLGECEVSSFGYGGKSELGMVRV